MLDDSGYMGSPPGVPAGMGEYKATLSSTLKFSSCKDWTGWKAKIRMIILGFYSILV